MFSGELINGIPKHPIKIKVYAEELEEAVMQYLSRTYGLDYEELASSNMSVSIGEYSTCSKLGTFTIEQYTHPG